MDIAFTEVEAIPLCADLSDPGRFSPVLRKLGVPSSEFDCDLLRTAAGQIESRATMEIVFTDQVNFPEFSIWSFVCCFHCLVFFLLKEKKKKKRARMSHWEESFWSKEKKI